MSTVNCIETYIDKNQNHYGCFVIEPLEIGQGITLGNTLRRTILSDLTSYSISGVRINNLKHEFSVIEGLREDVFELLLNIKEILLRKPFSSSKDKSSSVIKGFLNLRGPIIVTAGMFQLPENGIQILNPSLYLCTILDNSEFYLEIDIENGKGYKLSEEIRKEKKEHFSVNKNEPSTLFLDTSFIPVKNVNYKIKLIHDTKGNIKESLTMEILTNGSITPKRTIFEALKMVLTLFSSLFLNFSSLTISDIKKKN
jgi:DNA-directed RNA polymerase subunit alpha